MLIIVGLLTHRKSEIQPSAKLLLDLARKPLQITLPAGRARLSHSPIETETVFYQAGKSCCIIGNQGSIALKQTALTMRQPSTRFLIIF